MVGGKKHKPCPKLKTQKKLDWTSQSARQSRTAQGLLCTEVGFSPGYICTAIFHRAYKICMFHQTVQIENALFHCAVHKQFALSFWTEQGELLDLLLSLLMIFIVNDFERMPRRLAHHGSSLMTGGWRRLVLRGRAAKACMWVLWPPAMNGQWRLNEGVDCSRIHYLVQ